MDFDKFIAQLTENMPESWDGEDSPESIAIKYVHVLEERLKTLGGPIMLEKYLLVEHIPNRHIKDLFIENL